MKPKIKKLWVAALRSGEYRQAKHKLRKGSSFCCLGVLCNLYAQTHPKVAAKEKLASQFLGMSQLLPTAVVEWADLDNETGDDVCIGNLTLSLASHNDNGRTFEEIADAIEYQL